MADPWRYRCPRGHSDWRTRSDGTYYCKGCARSGADPKFDDLVDMKREVL